MNASQAPEIHVSPNPQALAQEAARRFVASARAAIASRGRFTVALSGGSTPKALFQLLAAPPYRDDVAWRRVYLGWGDERQVPPDHDQSNYRMARETLLDRVPAPPAQVYRIPAELPDPEAAAAAYAATLRRAFSLSDADGPPRFDLLYLGLGVEGHTASLFPDSPALNERTRLVAAPYVEQLGAFRLTLTPPVLNAAREVVFLVAGQDKAAIVREIIQGPRDVRRLPAQVVAPTSGRLVWLLDAAAAAHLDDTPARAETTT